MIQAIALIASLACTVLIAGCLAVSGRESEAERRHEREPDDLEAWWARQEVER